VGFQPCPPNFALNCSANKTITLDYQDFTQAHDGSIFILYGYFYASAMSADFYAGYISGAAGIIVGNPLDIVKTRLQSGEISPTSSATTGRAGFTFDRVGSLVRGMFASLS
jgi:hypothetical protein